MRTTELAVAFRRKFTVRNASHSVKILENFWHRFISFPTFSATEDVATTVTSYWQRFLDCMVKQDKQWAKRYFTVCSRLSQTDKTDEITRKWAKLIIKKSPLRFFFSFFFQFTTFSMACRLSFILYNQRGAWDRLKTLSSSSKNIVLFTVNT